VRVLVDLNRCQSYGRCVFAPLEVSRFHGEESLEYEHCPGHTQEREVERAALACPVGATAVEHTAETSAAEPAGGAR
jgi:ferredoxin